MERQLRHLVRITDDLLDVARITRNIVELRRERIDVRPVVHTAIEATRPLIDSHAQTLTVVVPPDPVWLDADATRLAQVFSNLLHNASKYTERGGQIRLEVSADDDAATVIVQDNGVGIPAEMLPRIFDMFTQLQEHRDRTHGGLGIGLTLARRLVELHSGTIEAASGGPGKGSRFTVRLPVARAEPARAAARPPESTPRHAACRVVVADDNRDAAEMMRLMLGFTGHDVRIATDGVQAVDLVRDFEPDIVFLDIGMPRMDGYEAARMIRQTGTPVTLVALTGWGQDEDRQRSREAGFDHHLTKPPEREVLERLITDCSRKR